MNGTRLTNSMKSLQSLRVSRWIPSWFKIYDKSRDLKIDTKSTCISAYKCENLVVIRKLVDSIFAFFC